MNFGEKDLALLAFKLYPSEKYIKIHIIIKSKHKFWS